MKKMITLLVLSLIVLTASATALMAVKNNGDTTFINLRYIEEQTYYSEDLEFGIIGDISDTFAIKMRGGDYFGYSVYSNGERSVVWFDWLATPTYFKYENGLIRSVEEFEEDGTIMFLYITITENAIHGDYIDIKKADYLPINTAKFAFYEDMRIIVSKPKESGLESLKNDILENELTKYDLNGRLIRDFDSFKGVYISGGKKFLKK